MTTPLTDPAADAVQVSQWVAAARTAAEAVNSQWASSTGNSLEILVVDNKGNSNLNVENALSSVQNTSNVVALLLAETETATDFSDDIARIGRFFQVRTLRILTLRTHFEGLYWTT